MPKNSAVAKKILFEISQPGEASGLIAARLAEEVAAQFGPREEIAFTLSARDAAGEVVGGVNGVIHWRWAYIRQFHINLAERGQGLGRALLKQVEHYAKQKDCVGVYLDTFDQGALAFYQSCGFAIAGAIENFPPGAARTFLSKPLA
jgi:GNAT superfamily N-acetyltransferase